MHGYVMIRKRFRWRARVCDEKEGGLSGVQGYVMRRKEV